MEKLYSVIAILDDNSKEEFNGIINRLLPFNESFVPHVTIAVYDKQPDVDALVDWTKQVAENCPRLRLYFDTIGISFGNCLTAIPSVSHGLYSLYTTHHKKFDDCCRVYSSIENNFWLPHITLLYTGVELASSWFSKLADVYKPIEAEIVALRITEFDGIGYKSLAQFDLK